MSLKSEITLTWGDGEFLFALKGAQIEELERVCGNVGIGLIFQRVLLGVYTYADLKHTVRLGLIGGGMGAIEAKAKTDMYMAAPLEPMIFNPDSIGNPNVPDFIMDPNSPVGVAKAVLGATRVGFEKLTTSGEAPAGN